MVKDGDDWLINWLTRSDPDPTSNRNGLRATREPIVVGAWVLLGVLAVRGQQCRSGHTLL